MSSSAPTYQLWYYTPSLGAAVTAAVIFGVLTVAHAFRLIQNRLWICIPLFIGGLFEILGYSCRAWAHFNTDSTSAYAIQSLLTLLAPILFAASIYMVLGRIILAARAETLSPIRLKWLTKLFVTGDVVCFLVQAGGGGIMSVAKTQSELKLGEHVILGGLILQILVFVIFVHVAIVWHVRMSGAQRYQPQMFPWRKYLIILYVNSAMIATRNIVRCAEFGAGANGYLLRHEWTTYVFDALLMVVVLVNSLFWYNYDRDAANRSIDVEAINLDITTK